MTKVLDAVEALGIDVDVKGEEANGLCPMHADITGKEDHNPSWWINLSSGQHICFSCGYKGGLLSLICDLNEFYETNWGGTKEYSYPQAKDWLARVTDVDPAEMIRQLKKLTTYVRQDTQLLQMSDARLAVYDAPTEKALILRGVKSEACEKYEVKWDSKNNRWILPLRDAQHGTLLGWQEKGENDRYFRNRPAGIEKSKTLFGLKNQQQDQVVVVESPLDAVRLASVGITGAVATCGAIVSKEQIKLLRASEKIICAFDNPKIDSAGKKASQEMRKAALQYGLNLFFFNYGDSGKKDPGDMSQDEIYWGMQNAKSSVWGESAYV